jgi:hypothetical protein
MKKGCVRCESPSHICAQHEADPPLEFASLTDAEFCGCGPGYCAERDSPEQEPPNGPPHGRCWRSDEEAQKLIDTLDDPVPPFQWTIFVCGACGRYWAKSEGKQQFYCKGVGHKRHKGEWAEAVKVRPV